MTMLKKEILARAIGIQNENWGSPRIFHIEALLSLRNALLLPIFFLDTMKIC